MASTDLNSDDVSAALLLVDKATKELNAGLAAKGYPKAYAHSGYSGYWLFNEHPRFSVFGKTFAEALAYIDELPVRGVWDASLCEQTLGVGEAA